MANLSSFWMHSNTIRIHDIDTTQNRKVFNALNLSRAKIFMQYLGIIASMVRYAIRNMRFHIVCCAMHKAIAKHICHWWCVISTRIHIMKSLKRKKKKKECEDGKAICEGIIVRRLQLRMHRYTKINTISHSDSINWCWIPFALQKNSQIHWNLMHQHHRFPPLLLMLFFINKMKGFIWRLLLKVTYFQRI